MLYAGILFVMIFSLYLLNRSVCSSLRSISEAFSSDAFSSDAGEAAERNDVLYKRQMQRLPGLK
jgi:hypothetical protein